MSRSVKKGVFVDPKLLEKVKRAKAQGGGPEIKTWSRSSTVTPEMVGVNLSVHNGRSFVSLSLVETMVGHRLGEFAPTRTFRKHGKKGVKAALSEGRV